MKNHRYHHHIFLYPSQVSDNNERPLPPARIALGVPYTLVNKIPSGFDHLVGTR